MVAIIRDINAIIVCGEMAAIIPDTNAAYVGALKGDIKERETFWCGTTSRVHVSVVLETVAGVREEFGAHGCTQRQAATVLFVDGVFAMTKFERVRSCCHRGRRRRQQKEKFC